MKKTERSIYNIVFGILSQCVTLILGVIIPRLYLVNYGSDVNGFLSTINQLYVYVGILEAGIGTASLYALYKPIAQDDKEEISAIMAATHYYYKKTSAVYFLAVIILSCVFPLLVKVNSGSLTRLTMSSVIFINGLSGVMVYIFHGKYKILLQAEGKNYVIINLNTITTVLTNVFRIILVSAGFNIIVVQLGYLVAQCFQIIYLSLYIKRKYAWMNLRAKPDMRAVSQKNSVFVHQISSLIFNNTDALLLTTICGASVASVYAIYTMVFGIGGTLIATFNTAVMYKLANLYNTDFLKFRKQYVVYEEFIFFITIGIFGVLMLLTPSFMKIYTSGVDDVLYADSKLAILFMIVYSLSNIRTPVVNMITISGNFKNTRVQSVIESVINITVSLIGIFKFGIYGVLLGTIVALLYRTNDLIIYNCRNIIKTRCSNAYFIIIKYVVITFVMVRCVGKLFLEGSSYLAIAVNGMIFLVVYSLVSYLTFIIQHWKNKEWKAKSLDFLGLFSKNKGGS